MVTEHLEAALGDLVDRSLRSPDQTSLDHVGDGPADPVVEDRDAALDEVSAVLLGEAHLGSHEFTDLLSGTRLAVLQGPQDRRHKGLILRDGHGSVFYLIGPPLAVRAERCK